MDQNKGCLCPPWCEILLKKLVFHSQGSKQLRLDLPPSSTIMSIRLANQARYLGVQVSYEIKSMASCTFRFRATVLRQWRAIAKSVVHLTHESTSSLLTRLQISDLVVLLAQKTVGHWTRRLAQLRRSLPHDVLCRAVCDLNQSFAEASAFASWRLET